MHKYIFQIGSNLHLAFAELVSVFGSESIKAYERDYFLLELESEFGQSDLDKLGSVMEVYEVLESSEFLDEHNIVNELSDKNSEGKIVFGLTSNFLDSKHRLDVLKKVKKNLKISLRFLESVSAASIKSGGALNERTFVYGFVKFLDEKYFSKLVAIQNIDEYSKRDYGKPYRSAKLGMLPPKLSQIMLNLAVKDFAAEEKITVYDPFCGTGTILIESLLAKHLVKGSDIQAVNIEGTKENLKWLEQEFAYKLKEVGAGWSAGDIFEADATKLKADDLNKVEVIVTEGFLGVPKQGKESVQELESEITELGNLYYNFLANLSKVNKKDGLTVVLTLPVFKGTGAASKKNFFIENLVEKLPKLGYSISALVPENKFGIKPKESVLYKRNDQKVFRQVYRLVHNLKK